MSSGNVLKGQKRKEEKVEREKTEQRFVDINYSDLFKFQHRNKIWISLKS